MFTCVCPDCKQEAGVARAALFDTILMSRKTCDKAEAGYCIAICWWKRGSD